MQKNREDAGDSSNDQADETDDVGQADEAGEAGEAETGSDAASKHGERPDNLRRRSEWFQKRHGDG